MNTTNTKLSLSACPFQTQLGTSIPQPGQKPILYGPPPAQIIKVACDRDKCQLWSKTDNVCAVSLIADEAQSISSELSRLTDQIADLNDTFNDLDFTQPCADKS